MEYTKIKEINSYVSKSVNPAQMPDVVFEMYSVPTFETGHPEYLYGREIASSKIVVKKNDILLCKINPRINRVWIVLDESDNPNIASSEWNEIRTDDYNPEFLAWYFRTPQFQQRMMSEVTGIGGSLTRAQPKRVAEYPVPVLDRQKQDRIATVLNKIANIISLRKQELKAYDELIKSRFIEMFGDPEQNPNGYPIKDFDEISVLVTDGEHATPHRTEKGIYLLSARNILNHALQLDDVDYIDEDEYARIAQRVVPQAGDVLISCSGSIGRCCVVPDGLQFQMVRSVALIRFDNTINPIFAEWLITSDELQRQIALSATQSSQANLFQGKIRKLHGYVPPMEFQQEFVAFVEQTNKSKLTIQKSLDELETLNKALMQKYFGGNGV